MRLPRLRDAARVPVLLVAVVVVTAAVGPFVTPNDPEMTMASAFQPPSGEFPLGTDHLGRDVLSRMLAYGWPIIVVPVVAIAVAGICGVAVGLWLAARPGRGRQAVQVLDVALAVPPILTLLVLGLVLPGGIWTFVLIAVVVNTPFTARFVRSLADGYFDAGFVEVSLVEGERRIAIAFREILPNLRSPLVGELGSRFVLAMYTLVTAAFLGLATLGDDGDWASMIADSLGGIRQNPAGVVAPAIGIGFLAVGVNLLADQWATRR